MLKHLIAVIVFLHPLLLFSQVSISGDFQAAPLTEVIQQLQTQHPLVFSYTEDVVDNQKITASFKQLPLQQGLELLLEKTDLSFEIVQEHYIVLTLEEATAVSLQGIVLDEQGHPLPFASILSKKTLKGTTTDENGSFRWENAITAFDSLLISYVGYESVLISVEQLAEAPSIRLKSQAHSFPEVLVKGYITTGIEQANELDHVILRPNKINVVPGLTEADVLQMIQLLPGVQSIDESATGLHIRGGTPDQNLILWDGIPIYNSGHFFGMISAFNPYIVDRVQVYRNGFGAEYGGRVSSVIDIHSVETIPDRTNVNAGINFTHADVSLVQPLANKKAALVLSARRAYTDLIESPTYKKLSQRIFQHGKIDDAQGAIKQEDGLDAAVDFNFTDLHAKWLWKPDKNNQFALSGFGIFDQLNFRFDDSNDNIQVRDKVDLDNFGGSAKWLKNWNSNFSTSASMSYTKVKNTLRFLFDERNQDVFSHDFIQANNIRDFTFRLENKLSVHKNFDLQFGFLRSALQVSQHWADVGEEGEKIDSYANIYSGHFTMNFHLGSTLRIQPGIRLTLAKEQNQAVSEPRLSLVYQPSKKWQFRTSAGRYFQFISQAIELNDLGLNQEMWILAGSDRNAPITKSLHYSSGFLYTAGTFQLELEGYYKRLSGLTSFSPVFINSFRLDIDAEGTGRAWGIDLLLKKKWKNYESWISYSYGRVFYNFDIYNEDNPFPAPNDRPHNLTSMHQLKCKNWNFSLSWKFASGKAYTQADDLYMEDMEVFPEYAYDRANANRLPVFHRLDASVLYRFYPKPKRMEGMIGLSVLNLYNRHNILSREYFTFYNDEEEIHELGDLDRSMLRFTPNLVLRLSWK
ncbi:MAG: TonB-dependent receptor [Bacteroidota bacterium]